MAEVAEYVDAEDQLQVDEERTLVRLQRSLLDSFLIRSRIM